MEDDVIRKVESKIVELSTDEKGSGRLSPKELANEFLKSRFHNASQLESTKQKAVNLLAGKIDDKTPIHQLMSIITLLDGLTSADVKNLIELAKIKSDSDIMSLLGGKNEETQKDDETPEEAKVSVTNAKRLSKLLNIVLEIQESEKKSTT